MSVAVRKTKACRGRGAGRVVGEADVFVDADDGSRNVPLRAVGDDPVAGRGQGGGIERMLPGTHTLK